jgi:class 3 adenylate cyclase
MDLPKTHYAQATDGTSLAYQVIGEGDSDLLYLNNAFSHLDIMWELPQYARFVRRLSAGRRIITFDKRGWGLSERRAPVADLETMLDDLRTVLDAADSRRTVLLGFGPMGGGACAAYAATIPERVRAFIWWGASARASWSPDYPWAETEQEASQGWQLWAAWGDESQAAELMRDVGLPSIAADARLRSWFARLCRYCAAPTEMKRHDQAWSALDVRGVLPSVHVPTLVTTRGIPDEARYLAGLIPAATVAVLHGEDYPPYLGDQEEVFGAIDSFLASVDREEAQFDRVLATVLFTDVVGSTRKTMELTDAVWKELLARHDTVIRGLLARYRGNEVKTLGDGFLATFDGPARAVRCAQGICEAVRPLGLEVRAGCHTGEIELMGADVGGVAVHIGARVAALAGPSEVLVSSTVKDLVAGSGLVFEDRGEHALKGVPEMWRLYAAVPGTA